jgi:PAS domain S-box-containing protein
VTTSRQLPPPDPVGLAEEIAPQPRRAAIALAAASVAIGAGILAGRVLDLPLPTSWLPGLVRSETDAALCLILVGLAAAIWLDLPGRPYRLIATALAAAAIAIAAATIFEDVARVSLGVDLVVGSDPGAGSLAHPGRFAVQTAVAFVAAGLAVPLLGRHVRGIAPSEGLGLAAGAIGVVSALGYLYGAPELVSLGSASEMSLPVTAALLALAVGILSADESHAIVRLWSDPGIAGGVIRRILPAAVVIIPAGAWLRLVGERAGLYDESIGLSIMVAFEALVLTGVGVWTTARVHRLEEERLKALADLIRLGAAASTPLIETAPVGLAVLDRDLRYLYVNPAQASIGGVSPVASLGQRIDRIVPAFANEPVAALARVVADGTPVRDVEVTGVSRRGGRPGTWLLSAEPLHDTAGATVGVAVSVVDITERKHREEALAAVAELQRQAQAIGESIPFGIWLAGPDGDMRYLSPPFLHMTGQTLEQVRGSGWLDGLAPEIAAESKQDWTDTVAAREPWNHELIFLAAEGGRRAILSRGFPIRDESGEVTSWAGINLDITDRKEAEGYREAFLAILSHELGTPTTSIYAASVLLSRPGLDEERRAELVDDIGHEAERLRRLVEDLVVLARAERGALQVHTEPVPLTHVVRKVYEQERRRWPDNTFELAVAAQVPVARAEESFVEQILRNLLDNAAKYGPADQPIVIVLDAVDGCPQVRVLDRGPGIDPAEAERLFEVYYRSQRTARVAGSGIGLFVAHRLVESIGGSIWARPRDEGGAEFGFQLQPFTEEVS